MMLTRTGLLMALVLLALLGLAAQPAAAATRLTAVELDMVRAGDQWVVAITTDPYAIAKASVGQPGVPPNTGLLWVNGFCVGPNGLVYLLRPLFF